MKAFVSFCVLFGATLGYHIPAPLDKKGNVMDTPEVAAEKIDHYLKLSKAGGAIPKDAFDHEYQPNHEYEHHDYRYHGPPAPLKHDGTVDETPEVKHVKAERLAALSEAFAKVHHVHKIHKRSYYEPAPLNHDGTVDETPEVKHVKSARLAALAEGFAKAKKGHNYIYESEQKYKGPPAPLKHDGTVDETPEVKHLKYEHLAAHAIAKAPQSEKHYYPEDTKTYKYYGPEAPLKHDGTVDETPEVKHLKHEHLSVVAHAFAKAPQGDEYEKHDYPEEKTYKYYGPEAPLKHDGTVDETPEVKHVKEARLAALSEAFAKAQYHKLSKRSLHYHGPPAPLKHDGTVDETPEVKHVKEARLAALSEAFAKAPHGYEQDEKHDYHVYNDKKYHGPPAPLNHDGTVAETPEVKHVKAEHLAAVKEAFAKAPHGYDEYEKHEETKEYHGYNEYHETKKYHGPPAPLNHDGTVAETPDVKHVKSARLSTLSEAYAKAPKDEHHIYKRSYGYHGPPAPLKHDGTVDETPEVKHVKAERLSALKEAFAKAPHGYDEYEKHEEAKEYHGYQETKKYHGPPAPLNHDGTVAETPEVKHVKAEHLAAVKEAFAKAPHGYDEYEKHEETKEYHGYNEYQDTKKYHGPPAPLNHDGTVAETPDVKHVKSARLSTLSEAYAKAPKDEHHHIYKRSAHYGYHGPPAPLKHDGTVDETPEVKHLKAEHLAALHEAFAKAPKGQNEISHHQVHEYVETKKYKGPPAPLNHDGTVAETPEVSHVKSERLAALHEAYSKAPQDYKEEYSYEPKSYPVYTEKHYVEPAPLNHDGTVAETPEVQARKYEHLAAHHKTLASLG